jgi:hypothetical protein
LPAGGCFLKNERIHVAGFFPLRGAFFEINAICLPAAVF